MPYERYYRNVPKEWKARRAKGSKSFREAWKGAYVIWENKMVFAEASAISQKRINLLFKDYSGTNAGVFYAKRIPFSRGWNIYHRYVFPEYRGLNLGRVGFRLMEFAIKRFGGVEIVVNTERTSDLNTLIGSGWKVAERSEPKLKLVLGLGENDKLPKQQEIRQILRERKKENLPVMIQLRRSLVGRYEKTTKPEN